MDKRLLVVNIYFAPQSFGGATIIAEEMATRLNQAHDWQVLVVTTHSDPLLPAYTLKRYSAKSINVISVNIPMERDYSDDYHNPKVAAVVEDIMDVFLPTVVHLHSIQTIGCSFFDYIATKEIALAITLHDCWWLCERQFMISSDGHYCFQEKIDFERCRYCVSDAIILKRRISYLTDKLKQADLLLSPSAFQRRLYIANGVNPTITHVNKNGIKKPAIGYRKATGSGHVVFGFVGGPGPIKGSQQIIDALNSMPDKINYSLLVVDAAQNAGTTWQDSDYWKIPGSMKFVPSYSQDTMDQFYQQIDVLLFPSQWKESFGLTVREALARDVWVIATQAGGVVEDIVPGVNGDIIPLDGDYQPLQQAVLACLERADWSNYINPHKDKIRDFDDQARELDSFLSSIIR